MVPINIEQVQEKLESFLNKEVYIHLETTNGAYATHFNNQQYNVGAFIRNAKVTFSNAKIKGTGSVYRVGLKLPIGWIYAEGLSDWTVLDGKLLLAGHDDEGRLMVALHISNEPFNQ